MQVTFQDFYGQFVTVHNKTSSGNIRLMIRTCENMNAIAGKTEAEMTVETDISLDDARAKILLNALIAMTEQS